MSWAACTIREASGWKTWFWSPQMKTSATCFSAHFSIWYTEFVTLAGYELCTHTLCLISPGWARCARNKGELSSVFHFWKRIWSVESRMWLDWKYLFSTVHSVHWVNWCIFHHNHKAINRLFPLSNGGLSCVMCFQVPVGINAEAEGSCVLFLVALIWLKKIQFIVFRRKRVYLSVCSKLVFLICLLLVNFLWLSPSVPPQGDQGDVGPLGPEGSKVFHFLRVLV